MEKELYVTARYLAGFTMIAIFFLLACPAFFPGYFKADIYYHGIIDSYHTDLFEVVGEDFRGWEERGYYIVNYSWGQNIYHEDIFGTRNLKPGQKFTTYWISGNNMQTMAGWDRGWINPVERKNLIVTISFIPVVLFGINLVLLLSYKFKNNSNNNKETE